MVEISIHGDRARFVVEGWDKLWALRNPLEIPLAHIRCVRVDPEPARGWWHGLKLAGTGIPSARSYGSSITSLTSDSCSRFHPLGGSRAPHRGARGSAR
jgi:hypothetical protein